MSHRRVFNDPAYDYHRWLVSLVDSGHMFWNNYKKLMAHLDERTYVYRSELDKNRYVDGLALREQYDYEVNESNFDVLDSLGDKECSCLECLVALFTRYSDNILVEPGDNSLAPELFYTAMENLGLISMDDVCFDSRKVDEILDDWMKNRVWIFEKCGKNSDLFLQCGKFCGKKYL